MRTRSKHLIVGALLMACMSGVLSPPSFAEGRRLNNLVTELVHLDSVALEAVAPITFTNPREGWIYLGFDADIPPDGHVDLLNADIEPPAVIIHRDARNAGRADSMRWMTAGEHKLRVSGKGGAAVRSLSVRTMPETHYVRYPDKPRFPQLGSFDWPWLKQHVLSSVNTVVGFPSPETEEAINEWTASGRKFIAYGSLPHDKDLTGEKAFDTWYTNPGFQDARLSGMIADEFNGRQNPLYPAWTDGMRLLGAKVKDSGKRFYAYCGGPGMYSRPESRALVRAVFDAGFYMAWERYHHEMPTEPEARAFMDSILGREMTEWRRVFPDCQRQMVMVLGLFAGGPDLDVQPQVNYKVWMDMQMQYLATQPQFDGLFGVHWWCASWSTEELLRWESALYRHYCIEGRTDLLSSQRGWTYLLDHIQNPDFFDTGAPGANGLDGWTAAPAGPDSLKAGYLERYAQVENRYWQRGVYPDDPAGNSYLWTKRQADKPNKVSQQIRHLEPGKVYTVQLITADYQDIVQGKSEQKAHAVSLTVDGADLLPEGGYQSVPVSSPWSHEQLPFKNGPAWFNHHRVMFRAKASTAQLTISDWASPTEPGGPVGQELMSNYVQVQPYYEE